MVAQPVSAQERAAPSRRLPARSSAARMVTAQERHSLAVARAEALRQHSVVGPPADRPLLERALVAARVPATQAERHLLAAVRSSHPAADRFASTPPSELLSR